MLVLTRRINETIRLQDGPDGNPIFVTVLGWRGNQIKLGFSAPQSVKIDRQEIWERIHANPDTTNR